MIELIPGIAPSSARGQNIGMARLRRRWRVAKWAGLVLFLLTGMAWIGSWLLQLSLHARCLFLDIGDGDLFVQYDSAFRNAALDCIVQREPFAIDLMAATTWSLNLHFRTLLAVIGVPTAIIWLLDRRRQPHCCQACGYNLTGNMSGICPECGVKVNQPGAIDHF